MIEGLPILISSFRIAIVPVLWVFAALNWQPALALGLFFAVLSDWLDGQVGRWLKHDSEQESRIDSLADKILTLSVLLWLVWLHPQIVSENLILVGFVLLLGIISWGLVCGGMAVYWVYTCVLPNMRGLCKHCSYSALFGFGAIHHGCCMPQQAHGV
jgi:phosphatidylglycerophosphate synthase